MQLSDGLNEPGFYFKYSEQMKEKYGQKVYKIPVNLPVSCPVRDGSLSSEGCIFCGEKAAGHESLANTLTPAMQIQQNIDYIAPNYGAKLFEIYFQNFNFIFKFILKCETYELIKGYARVPHIAH